MRAENTCPDPSRLRALLDGQLTQAEQADVASHVESCASCQQRLDAWSADSDVLGGRKPRLDAAAATDPALRRAVDALKVDPPAAVTHDTGPATISHESEPPASTISMSGSETVPAAVDAPDLHFLDAPTLPRTIGRFGPYHIEKLIGRGGMGIVLKATDSRLQRPVAVKVMAPVLAADGVARRRFLREAQAAAAVVDEHVVTIHAVDEANDLPYLVMQYVAGMSLQQKVDRGGPLELKEILRIGKQVAEGLAAAHKQGLVHRDIKPANILLENGVQRVKITDFGLARAADDASLSTSGVVAGTPMYMSPEQARGEAIDPRTDLFSLGSVLYAMCTGRAPFRANSTPAVLKRVCDETPKPIREVNPDVPPWLAATIKKLHAKEPGGRYQSAAEVAALLETHLAELQLPARVGPKARRRWVPVGLALLVIAGLAVGFGLTKGRNHITPAVPKPPPATAVHPAAPNSQSHDRPALDASAPAPQAIDWKTGPYDEDFPGLAAAPLSLPGVERWQTETRAPRGVIKAVSWSPRRDWIAVVAQDPAIRIYDAKNLALLRVLNGHTIGAETLAWHASEPRLLSTSEDGSVRLWNVEQSAQERSWVFPAAPDCAGAAWSRDGRRVSFANSEGIHILDVNNINNMININYKNDSILKLAFSPDGRWLASAGQADRTVRLWNPLDGTPGPTFKGHEEAVMAVTFHPDGRYAATASLDKTVRLWDVHDGAQQRVLSGHTQGVLDASFSDDGTRLVSASRDEVRVWTTAHWDSIPVSHDARGGFACSISADGRRIAAGWQNQLEIREVGEAAGKPVLASTIAQITSVALQPGGMHCASGQYDGTVRTWNISDGAQTLLLKPAPDDPFVFAVAFSPDGRRLASASSDQVRLWAADDGKPGRVIATDGGYRSLAWSPDHTKLAAANTQDEVRIWNVDDDTPPLQLDGAENWDPCVAFSPDGQRLGAVFGTKMFLWNVGDGQPAAVIEDQVYSIAFHPDGTRLVTGAGMLIVRDSRTGARLGDLAAPQFWIRSLAFSPRGRLASGGQEATICLWNLGTDQVETVLPRRGGPSSSAAFAGEDRLVSASFDGTLRLWDLTTGQPLWTAIPVGPDRSVRITPAGRLLASELGDTHAFVYLVQTQADGPVDLVTPAEFEARFGALLRRKSLQ